MLMRRHEHSEKEETLLQKISKEYTLFRYKMLSGSVQEVYNQCNQIRFYECMQEYFQYKEKLPPEFVQATEGREDILQELWGIYLKYEYLRIDEWSDLEDVLKMYVGRQEAAED